MKMDFKGTRRPSSPREHPGSSLSLPSRPVRAVAPWALAAAVFVLAFFAPGLEPKEKKVARTVSGQVLDQDENGILGAAVELTDLQTGKKLAMFSEDGGHYKFTDLDPLRDYTLQATYKGLSSEVRKVSSFDLRNTFVIYLKIPPPKTSDKR